MCEMNLEVGDLVSFDELPDELPWGVEGKVVFVSSCGYVLVHVPGHEQCLGFSDLYGSWDSLGNFKVDRFYSSCL